MIAYRKMTTFSTHQNTTNMNCPRLQDLTVEVIYSCDVFSTPKSFLSFILVAFSTKSNSMLNCIDLKTSPQQSSWLAILWPSFLLIIILHTLQETKLRLPYVLQSRLFLTKYKNYVLRGFAFSVIISCLEGVNAPNNLASLFLKINQVEEQH